MRTRRILVRAPNWLGDMVMALPAIRLVRHATKDAHIVVAAPAGAAALFSFAPDVDEVVPLPGAKGFLGLRRLADDVAGLGAARPDVAVLLTNSFSSARAVSRAGIPERWGYRTDGRGHLLTRAIRRRDAATESRHHAEYYLALMRALGFANVVETDAPYLCAREDARTHARKKLEAHGWAPSTPLIGIAPGAAYGRAKQYPSHLIVSLVGDLLSNGWTIVLIGAREDHATGLAIERALGPSQVHSRLVNLIGKTDLTELVGVVDACRAFVSNDSGAMHIAAALGTPVVAIFGSTDEHATAPIGPHVIVNADVWCRPCLLRECPIDHRCMRRIPPRRVADAVRDVLTL